MSKRKQLGTLMSRQTNPAKCFFALSDQAFRRRTWTQDDDEAFKVIGQLAPS